MKPSYRIAELERIGDAFRQRAIEAERERDEMNGALKASSNNAVTWMKRALKAETEIARRDAVAGEPVAWQFYDAGAWHNGSNHNNHRENTEKAGYRIRELCVMGAQQHKPVVIPDLPHDCDRTEAHFKYIAALDAAGVKHKVVK